MKMEFKKFSKTAILLTALIAAAQILPALPAAADSKTAADIEQQIKQQESEYKKLQAQMSKNRQKIKEKQQQERDVSAQLNALSQKITVTQQKVNIVSLHMKKVQNNIFVLTNNIKTTGKAISTSQNVLRKRLVNIYKYGSVAQYNLMLSSQGAEDALANTYLLSRIAKQDQDLINLLTEQRRKLVAAQDELKRQHMQLRSQGTELNKQKNNLKSAADERNTLLAQVRKDKRIFMAQQEIFIKASKELQGTVKRLLAQKKKLMAAKHPGKKQTVYYKGGRLAWPLQGTINSTFGTRVHPVFKTRITHTGIDIGAPKGTPVKAANPGEVLYTGWMRGYGQVVILDHGADLTTVYAHLSSIETSENAKVTRDTVIGRVGSTGVATGNHLHFEVRVDGNAVDPMRYLR